MIRILKNGIYVTYSRLSNPLVKKINLKVALDLSRNIVPNWFLVILLHHLNDGRLKFTGVAFSRGKRKGYAVESVAALAKLIENSATQGLDISKELPITEYSTAVGKNSPRILLLLPKFFGETWRENDLGASFYNSGISIGLDICWIANDYLSYGFHKPESPSLAQFEQKMSVFDPNVILIDGNSNGVSGQLTASMLLAIKRQSGARVGTIMADGWSPQYLANLKAWQTVTDTFFFFESDGKLWNTLSSDSRQRIALPIYWGKKNPPRPQCDLLWSGTLHATRSKLLRQVLQRSQELGLDARFYPTWPQVPSGLLDDLDEYFARLQSSRAVLSTSRRISDFFPITGRYFEVPASGSLLLQETKPGLPSPLGPLTPYAEYLPFRTASELTVILQALKGEPRLIEEVAKRGHYRAHKEFAPDKVWRQILLALD